MSKECGKRPRVHYGWIVLAMGMLTTIGGHGFGRMAYTVILPAMKEGLQFTYAELGLLGTGNFIGYLTSAMIGGILAVRFSTRIVMTMALILMGVSMILTGLAQSFPLAFGMRLLTGLGHGAAFVPAMALGSAWFAFRRRGLASGLISSGTGLGVLISGFTIPWILAEYGPEGWRYSWYYLGAAVLLISVVVGSFVRSRPEEKGLSPIGAERAYSPIPEKAAGSQREVLPWGSVYRVKEVWVLGLVYFLYGFSYIIYMTFFVAYLIQELGFSPAQAGRLWGLAGGLMIFGGTLWGTISDLLGRSYGLALAYLTLAVAFAVFALARSGPGPYISAFIYGLTTASVPTIMAATVGDHVGPRLAPAGLGFITLFFGIGQALGPVAGGYLADLARSFEGSFLLAAGVSLLGAFASLYLRAPQKNERA